MNNLRILTIKNAKFSGYYFYMNLNIWGDFQIWISVLLTKIQNLWAKNSRILRIQNAKFVGCCFYMNTNIRRDFQNYINVPLNKYFMKDLLLHNFNRYKRIKKLS